MMRAVLYARLSPKPDEDAESIEVQHNELLKWSKERFHDIHGQLFHDTFRSGAELERPGLLAAIKALRPGDCLVVRDLSRFVRSLYGGLDIEQELRAKGCFLASMEDGGFVMNPNDGPLKYHDSLLPRIVKYWNDERERLFKNARTSRRMKEHQANGRRMSRHLPYGWQTAPNDKSHGSLPARAVHDNSHHGVGRSG